MNHLTDDSFVLPISPLTALRVADLDTRNLEYYIKEWLDKHNVGIYTINSNAYEITDVDEYPFENLARYIAERMNGIL